MNEDCPSDVPGELSCALQWDVTHAHTPTSHTHALAPLIGVCCVNEDWPADVYGAVTHALQQGYRLLDSAKSYK